VKALFSILGLRFDCKYETNEERLRLRYGHVMLMTDQDTDGSHIKGLILNFFRHFWPCLLKPAVDDMTARPFLSSFITPLLKAQCGKRDTLNFFSLSDYNNWKASLPQDTLKKWTVKYYKGLGTNTHAEAKEYFNDFPKYHRPFRWESEEDGKFIDMLFDKDRSDDRKKWMIFNTKRHHAPPQASASIDDSVRSITYQNFINTEMIEYSSADNIRSLPSVIDGLKPSQRKVLYACFKRKLKNEIKVAQLSGYCAEHTSYHHGEASLHATSK
jgi:DNA topoisomerase-2